MRLATETLVAIAIVANTFGVSAEWINKSGERLPDAEHRKAIGNFGAQLILVPDDEQMFKVWGTPAETVNISTVQSVAIGGQANAFVIFSGCTPDKAGHCDVTVQFRVYQPNGRPYGGKPPPMEVWQHKPAPAVRMLELSVQYLKVVIEPQDLLGKYVVVADVRDHVSGALLQLSSVFTATK
jgi:hypothetical protein